MNTRKSVIIGAILLLISGAAFAHTTLKPKIRWIPETLNLPSLKPGESITTTVVFINASLLLNQKLKGEHLTFQTESGAGTHLTASALFPKKIAPGEKVAVTLTVSAASSTQALPPRVISGKVQLVKKERDNDKDKREKGEKEKTRLLGTPILVNSTISPFPLPPEPDKTLDDATLEGIDSNGNGVRDRTERYIGFTYPNSEKLRMGLMQDARVYEAKLRDSGDKAATRAHVLEWNTSYGCLVYLFSHNLDASEKATRELKANFILDSDLRLRAQHNASAQVGGMVWGENNPTTIEEEKALCSFNPDTLPN